MLTAKVYLIALSPISGHLWGEKRLKIAQSLKDLHFKIKHRRGKKNPNDFCVKVLEAKTNPEIHYFLQYPIDMS